MAMRTVAMSSLVALVVAATVAGSIGCAKASTEMPRGTVPPIDVAAPPADAVKTDSGLFFRILARGESGRHPGPDARVTVHYTGWTTDGTIVEGAPREGAPATFDMIECMPGWREGLHMMVPGEKRRFWVPPNLAYAGTVGRPQGMLVYDIELVSFTE